MDNVLAHLILIGRREKCYSWDILRTSANENRQPWVFTKGDTLEVLNIIKRETMLDFTVWALQLT